MMNGIWYSLGQDLVNTKLYTNFYQIVPYGSIVRTRFSFSEFGPRLNSAVTEEKKIKSSE